MRNKLIFFVAAICLTPALAKAQTTPAKVLEGLPLVFSEDFSDGAKQFELTDKAAWELHKDGDNTSFGLNKRKSDYQPKHRSPHNIALIKELKLSDFIIKFRVKSTLDTGGHRDCCVFFCHQDAEHFYYVHLGARPDPHSGQIMIVNDAPRIAITKNENQVPWDDQWHQVMLKRSGKTGQIEVFFDDMKKPIMSATDKNFSKGRIGLGSFDDMNDFDDIQIYGK